MTNARSHVEEIRREKKKRENDFNTIVWNQRRASMPHLPKKMMWHKHIRACSDSGDEQGMVDNNNLK